MKYSVATLVSALALVKAIPDGIPSESTARSLLSELTVFESSDDGSYDRDLFPTWDTIEGTCNAREYVLRRDGDGVEVGSDCYPTAGTWTCPYDGTTHSVPSEVSIDHMVPLKNAWISGASEWTTADREAFANDVKGVQLWAVTGTTNSKKSDKSPDEWQPPRTEIHCQYAAAWIQVKSTYKLTVTAAEQSSLEEMLGSC